MAIPNIDPDRIDQAGKGIKMKKIIVVVLSLLPLFSRAQVISDFEDGTLQNWRTLGDGAYFLEAENGNPGNCLRVEDDATGSLNTAIAPVKFTGNWTSSGPTDSIFFDLYVHLINGSMGVTGRDWLVRISGPGGQAEGGSLSENLPQSDTWLHYALPLDSTHWRIVSGTWPAILENVDQLEIGAEYVNGDEYDRLDNIGLSFSPNVLPVNPPVFSGFEAGNLDGWSFINTGGIDAKKTGGNPGGHLQVADGSGIAIGYAPPRYLGNWQLLNGKAALQFDLKIEGPADLFALPDFLVKISGSGNEARIKADSSLLAAFNTWHSFSFMIDPAVWQVTAGTWQDLLKNVSELAITLEFVDGDERVNMDNFNIINNRPDARFSARPVYAFEGDTVQFTDSSAYVPGSWNWSFGDGQNSSLQNPAHLYMNPGTYDVRLIVSNYFGADTLVRENYIEIASLHDSILYKDDFDDGMFHPAWTFGNGTWTEQDGIISQTSNFYTATYREAATALTGSHKWQDYRVSADVRSADNDAIGLIFNYRDPDNYYLFMMHQERNFRGLLKFEDGVHIDLDTDEFAYETDRWYHVVVVQDSASIMVYVDSILTFNVADSSGHSGLAGLYSWGNEGSYFDNFVVSHKPVTTGFRKQQEFSPEIFTLEQNFPNPFNPQTQIRFYLPRQEEIDLTIFDLNGRKVTRLLKGRMSAGRHSVTWAPKSLASGVYWYELKTDNWRSARKMIYLR